ncbi:MAG: BamA/TamA family outer membrane protein, partial [Bacteroidia bacterium]
KSYSQENHYIVIDTITFEGNNQTKQYVIERELLFKKDSIYESAQMDEMAKNSKNLLNNTNLFITVEVKWTETRRQHVSISVIVSEKWYIWPIPFFELADRNYKQWADLGHKADRTNYGLYLFTYNFRGRNETIKLSFINGYTRNYGIQYYIPFLDKSGKYGLDINSSFKQNREIWYLTKNDSLQFYKTFGKTLIQRFENRLAFTIRRNNFITERWEAEFNNIKIKDTISSKGLNPEFLLGKKKQNEFLIKHFITYEKRDNKYYPLTGFYIKNEVALGTLSGDTASVEILRETLELGIYREIYKKLYLSGFFKTKLSNEPLPFIPYNNFKSFGYKDYVRGYEQYVIDGHAFLLGKINLKYALVHRYMFKTPFKIHKKPAKLPTSVYLNLYSDWGKAYNNQWGIGIYNNNLVKTNLVGYGVGIDFLFLNDKIFRLEYSLNILGDKNFNLHFDKSF